MDEELATFLADYYSPKQDESDLQLISSIFEIQRILCRHLALVRMRLPMTQQQLAEKVRTTQPVIARIEAGSGNPSLQMVLKICHQLKIELKPQQGNA